MKCWQIASRKEVASNLDILAISMEEEQKLYLQTERGHYLSKYAIQRNSTTEVKGRHY